MAINIKTQWGISESNTAVDNSNRFNSNIASGQTLYLPGSSDPYPFDLISIKNVDNVEFFGDTDTIIKLGDVGDDHSQLEIANADNFNLHDLKFDGRLSDHEGGVWAKDGATNGIIKNIKVYDPHDVGIVIGGSDYEPQPKTFNITVEDCEVYGQRNWDGNSKASFLAGGGADDITFKNCTAHRKGFYDDTPDSPADLFDTDDATNVKYINCTAIGTDNETIRKGVGFWNEGEQEASSEYWDCTAIKTGGGLGATQQSTAIAHNFTFDDCSWDGWAARVSNKEATLEIYDSTFDGCFSYYQHYRGGCVVIEGAATIDNCIFKNTPSTEYDEYNITLYTPDDSNNKTVTIENNTCDRSLKGFNDSKGTGDVYVRYNNFASGTEIIQGGGYNWIISGNTWGPSTTTTAINSPTSSTTVSVEYQSHFTSVQYNSGESFDWMLVKMRDAINADSGAYITADINMNVDKITFTKKDAGYPDNQVSIYIQSSDWGNGNPFKPMNPVFP